MKAKNFFLPAGDPKGTGNTQAYGGTIGGPISKNKLFYFASVEAPVNARCRECVFQLRRQRPAQPADDGDAQGNFAGTGAVIYDPRTGVAGGAGRVPFAFANCPGVTSTSDPRFDSCNYIPAIESTRSRRTF